MGQLTTDQAKSKPYAAFVLVALFCGGTSIVIVQTILSKFNHVSDSGFWAMSTMASSPAILGLGISYFIYRTSLGHHGRDFD